MRPVGYGAQPLSVGEIKDYWREAGRLSVKQRYQAPQRRLIVNEDLTETLAPELCASKIFEISGTKFDTEAAADLWPRILQHKWLLSEKLGRDVGLRVACIDFLENMEQAREEYLAYKRRDILNEMGAQTLSKELWDTISDSQPPKQIVQRKIILPLTKQDL